MTTDEPLPRALEILWRDATPARRTRGLSRERIVAAAIELADADGLAALSTAPYPPPMVDRANWHGALTDWAAGLWEVYHRHPWVLHYVRGAAALDIEAADVDSPDYPALHAEFRSGLGRLLDGIAAKIK